MQTTKIIDAQNFTFSVKATTDYVVPVCASCLECIHFGGDPDFAYRLAENGESCEADDHVFAMND